MTYVSFAAPLLCWFAASATAQNLDSLIDPQLPSLVDTYKSIHSHPELSHHEERTAAILAAELRKAGYAVTERVGKYPDGSQAYGVVGILENGAGPRLLIRADMDALPIVEQTDVPYASHVRSKNAAGQDVGVMHACGHDVHATTLMGTARTLSSLPSQWHGMLMLVGQPSEETIDGAKAMLADHLYERFGRPDFAIALHDTNELAAGTVSMVSGASQAASTSVDVTLRRSEPFTAAPGATSYRTRSSWRLRRAPSAMRHGKSLLTAFDAPRQAWRCPRACPRASRPSSAYWRTSRLPLTIMMPR